MCFDVPALHVGVGPDDCDRRKIVEPRAIRPLLQFASGRRTDRNFAEPSASPPTSQSSRGLPGSRCKSSVGGMFGRGVCADVAGGGVEIPVRTKTGTGPAPAWSSPMTTAPMSASTPRNRGWLWYALVGLSGGLRPRGPRLAAARAGPGQRDRAHVVVDYYSFIVVSLLPLLSLRLGLTNFEKAMLLGSGSVASGFIQPLVAWIGDRLNTRVIGTAGLGVAAAACSAVGLAQNFWQLPVLARWARWAWGVPPRRRRWWGRSRARGGRGRVAVLPGRDGRGIAGTSCRLTS